MANSRNKGAGGERELASLIKAVTGVEVKRNLEAVRSGGSDFIVPRGTCLSGYSIECKRYKAATPASFRRWVAQAKRQAELEGKTPILFFREDFKKWRCITHDNFVTMLDMDAIDILKQIQSAYNQ